MNNDDKKIPLGISSCLLGQTVRYDGGHKYNDHIVNALGDYFSYKPFCPEVNIGLGTPRETIKLVEEAGDVRCIGTKDPTLDVTDALTQCANQQRSWQQSIYGYIFKKGSPSCGIEHVKIFRNNTLSHNGIGIYAQQLMLNFPNIPIEDEARLSNPALSDNFIQRVLIYKRWKDLIANTINLHDLFAFHTQHSKILTKHNQTQAQLLTIQINTLKEEDVASFVTAYESSLMTILKGSFNNDMT